MTSDIPVPTEKDYLDAARAFSETARLTGGFLVPTVEESAALYAANRKFRAAVDSAHAAGWRAGYGQGRDDEAAGDDLPTFTGARTAVAFVPSLGVPPTTTPYAIAEIMPEQR